MSSEEGERQSDDSSSSSTCSSDSSLPNLNALKPYDMEPMRSALDLSENSYDSSENSSDEENEKKRIGNTEWCMCGKCKVMLTYTESLCCRETNEVPDENFEGIDILYIAASFSSYTQLVSLLTVYVY